jgi:hypothetical protein
MDLIEEHPVENLTRKRGVFEIASTSREALQCIYPVFNNKPIFGQSQDVTRNLSEW